MVGGGVTRAVDARAPTRVRFIAIGCEMRVDREQVICRGHGITVETEPLFCQFQRSAGERESEAEEDGGRGRGSR